MLLRESEFLKVTNMNKNDLYAKVAMLQLLGVDFKIDEVDKILYKGQYYNRKTNEVLTGHFCLRHFEPNIMQLFFTDYSKSVNLAYVTISNALVYLIKDDYMTQLEFFMEFIKEDYMIDFSCLDIFYNISGISRNDFEARLSKNRLLGVFLSDFSVPLDSEWYKNKWYTGVEDAIKVDSSKYLICRRVNDMTFMLEFRGVLIMIPYPILLAIGSVDDLMIRYLNAVYEHYVLARRLKSI